jgi:hypothetical protein
MGKTRPSEIIAARFQISKESAMYFLIQVQKSFNAEKPPQKLIVEFMATRDYLSPPTPYQVARGMNEEGIWVRPLHSEPPAPLDEEDSYDR